LICRWTDNTHQVCWGYRCVCDEISSAPLTLSLTIVGLIKFSFAMVLRNFLAFFKNPWRKQLIDPTSVVIVAEDAKFPEEDQSPLVDGMDKLRANSDRRIVGVCSWNLESGSARNGQFSPPGAESEEHSLNHNVDKPHMSLVDEIKYKGRKW
jgi:hypothetical protein